MALCRTLVVALFALSACSADQFVISISTELPVGDNDARSRLTSIEIELWPEESRACMELHRWQTESCLSRVCPPWPRPSGEPLAHVTLTKTIDGAWAGASLTNPPAGPWDLVAIGIGDSGSFLYGCESVSESSLTIELWRPWCDPAGCLTPDGTQGPCNCMNPEVRCTDGTTCGPMDTHACCGGVCVMRVPCGAGSTCGCIPEPPCEQTCTADNYACCGGQCTNLLTSLESCGRCGNDCRRIDGLYLCYGGRCCLDEGMRDCAP